MKWIFASEVLPPIRMKDGATSNRVNVKKAGIYPDTGIYFNDGREEYFEFSDGVRFNKDSFHLIEWLDEDAPHDNTQEPHTLEQAAESWAEQCYGDNKRDFQVARHSFLVGYGYGLLKEEYRRKLLK